MAIELSTVSEPTNATDSYYGPTYDDAKVAGQYIRDFIRKAVRWYRELKIWQKVCIGITILSIFCAQVWTLLHYQLIVNGLVRVSDTWQSYRIKGALILFTGIFIVGFPPCVGFNFLCVFTGMTYGWKGWPLIAIGYVLGSTCSFALFKFILMRKAQELMDKSENLQLFVDALNDESSPYWEKLLILSLLRLSPLPYSFSNGALGAIPGIETKEYVISGLVTSPKLFLVIFVGNTIRQLGDTSSSGSRKLMQFISMFITTGSFGIATYLIFCKMKRKIHERYALGVLEDGEELEAPLMN